MKRTNIRNLISSMLAAGLLMAALVPATTAAPPRWFISATQQAAYINAGGAQAFDITIRNDGKSNISSLYLIATPDDEGPEFVEDAPVFISSSRAGACNTNGGGVLCDFGALNKGAPPITVTVAYAFPLESGANSIFFGLNTTGLVLGENNSHGDATFTLEQVVDVLPAGEVNRGGRFTTEAGQLVANVQAVSRSNVQATKLLNLAQYVAATVQDGSTVSFSCPKQKCPGKLFGEWSAVNVEKGLTQDAPFQVQLTIAGTSISGNPETSDVFVYHVRDLGGIETIKASCGDTVPATGCINSVEYVGGNLVITFSTWYNGGFKGAF